MVIKRAKKYPAVDAVVGHGGRAAKSDIRESTVRWLDASDLDLFWLYRRIQVEIVKANERGFGYALSPISTEFQFTEYHATNHGHYNWHTDNASTSKEPYDRKLSMVIQLSDPSTYDGGQFELTQSADPLPPEALKTTGQALIFRSCLEHRVLPVTRGTRYSLVTWIRGPRS